ncbi:MAG: ATP phosphoribosyltransferase regulatory subunit [Evtepia gabavorous]
MQLDWTILRSGEQIMYRLRGLYERYGYRRFKMSKFEEYDLYVRNKDFLVSDRMITFTDARGILMALKPDVTLSIIKNTRAEEAGPERSTTMRASTGPARGGDLPGDHADRPGVHRGTGPLSHL